MPLLMPTLTGRFGNLLFQYAHARAWCEQNHHELCLPPWVGEKVFTIPEAVRPKRRRPDIVWTENLRQDQDSLIYTRSQVRKWFTLRPEILDMLVGITSTRFHVVLNVREGQDYRDAGLVTISRESYSKACRDAGYDPVFAVWETDTRPTTLPRFTSNPNASGLGTTWACIPSFYRLMSAPVLFRANSTFSWWAATLGNGRVFAPNIRGIRGGVANAQCDTWVEANWPACAEAHTDLYLPD